VLAFGALAAVICLALIGIAPTLQVARTFGRSGLRADSRAATLHRAGLRRWFIGAEAAIVVLLLTVALLFLRTFTNLRHVDLGFEPDRVVVVEARWPVGYLLKAAPGTRPWPRVRRAVDGLIQTVGAIPGVQAAGLITQIPLTSDPYSGTVWRQDAPGSTATRPPIDARDRWSADLSVVTPGYFPAMNLTFRRGRNFNDQDRYTDDELSHPSPSLSGVAVVNSAFASRYFPGVDPVGRVILLGEAGSFGAARTIVGVVTDARQRSVADAPRPTIFVPHAQNPDIIRPSLAIRASLPFATVASAIRDQLHTFDPQLVILDVRPMDAVIAGALSRPRFNLLLIGAFAALALGLAAVGIYGVVAVVMTQRTREVGIRVALGARPGDVVALLIADGMRPVIAGVLMGVLMDIAATRVLRSMLFGVTPLDPVSIAGAAAALGAIALLACYFPARHALRIDPLAALREE
jgi:putative ABC transport system permease protein